MGNGNNGDFAAFSAHSTLGWLWYELAYMVCTWTFTLGFSFRSSGRNHVPRTGPALLLANHQSFFDPVLVAMSTRRHLTFLARKTLFRNRLFGRLIHSLDAIPIDHHGVAKEGLRAILQRLQQGAAVLVFPEGTRTRDGNMSSFRPGMQLLIKHARPPIIPIGIAGAYQAWPTWRPYPLPGPLFLPPNGCTIAVAAGEPLDGNALATLPRAEMLAQLEQRVRAAQDQAERLRRQ